MGQIFEFQDVTKSVETIIRTWDEYRQALARKDFYYNEVDKALNLVFLKQFDNMHTYMNKELQLKLNDVNSKVLLRGTILKKGEVPDYNRMIPNAEYITKDNRFSPPGIEWLYLSLGETRNDSIMCSQAECRKKSQDRFASCEFKVDKQYRGLIVADLTKADNISIDEINNKLEMAGQKYKKKAVRNSIKLGIPTISKYHSGFDPEIESWLFKTYMKLLSENIFLPLDESDDKSIIYAPFQCLAQYFIQKGYAGIIYKSTVSEKGKNIVLFDKTYAVPVGNISVEEPENE